MARLGDSFLTTCRASLVLRNGSTAPLRQGNTEKMGPRALSGPPSWDSGVQSSQQVRSQWDRAGAEEGGPGRGSSAGPSPAAASPPVLPTWRGGTRGSRAHSAGQAVRARGALSPSPSRAGEDQSAATLVRCGV